MRSLIHVTMIDFEQIDASKRWASTKRCQAFGLNTRDCLIQIKAGSLNYR